MNRKRTKGETAMMTKEQCSAVIEQFSTRIKIDQIDLDNLKATYQSMFGIDWDDENRAFESETSTQSDTAGA